MTENRFTFDDILHFYESAGVDCALSEKPHNRFIESEESAHRREVAFVVKKPAEKNPPIKPTSPRLSTPAPIPGESEINNAINAAQQAGTLEELRTALEHFSGCGLKFTAKNTSFDDGTPNSPLMFIGEAPGRDEDIQGKPFAGLSGALLNRMLTAIGLNRDSVYLANIIFWRPPGDRAPTAAETEICRPFIERQIELANPKILIAMGGPAAQLLTGGKQAIVRLRGHWHDYKTSTGQSLPLMATLHPNHLLRFPAQKKLAWQDLLEIKARLDSL